MNIQTSRKTIVASGMAVAVAIGVVTFALRSHPVTSIAPIPPPPAAIAQIPAVAPAVVEQVPDVAAAVANNDSVGTKSVDSVAVSAVAPKPAHSRHLVKSDTRAVDRVKSADELPAPLATSNSLVDDQKVATITEVTASDSQITADVKSEIAGDSLSKDANIGVTTTHGIVALTGNLASQVAIDHVKDVAQRVKDVKSVDPSALTLASPPDGS
jgi:hypothetical protein